MKTILIILLFPLTLLAQNVAVLTHGAANTQDFREGCPTNWPYRIIDIGRAEELPKDLPGSGWILLSREALKESMDTLSAAKEAWNSRETPAVTTRKQLIADIVSDLRAIRNSSGPLTAAQMSNAFRRIATVLLILLEEDKVSLNP